jgi:Adenovirus endoprotease
METNQIREMLSSFNCKNINVIPADGLSVYTKQKPPPVGFQAVVNTDPSTKMGEHWLCLKVLSSKVLLLFDSLSSEQHVHNKYIRSFREIFLCLERNQGLLQDPFSTSCGLFCVYFFHFLCNEKMSLNDIVKKKFTKNVVHNECLVLEFIASRYDKKLYSSVRSTCVSPTDW